MRPPPQKQRQQQKENRNCSNPQNQGMRRNRKYPSQIRHNYAIGRAIGRTGPLYRPSSAFQRIIAISRSM